MSGANQQQVADATGCSLATVSLVLRGQGRISAATRSRVLLAAKRLGYRQGALAHGLAGPAVGALAYLTHLQHFQPPALLFGIAEAIARRNRAMLFALVPSGAAWADSLPALLRDLAADGALFHAGMDLPPRLRGELSRQQRPVVWLNSWGEHRCVAMDDFGAALAITRTLLGRGHRRIAHVTTCHATAHRWFADRRRGYEQAMSEAGLPPQVSVTHDTEDMQVPEPGARRRQCRALLTAADRPTAVFALGPEHAETVLSEALRCGLDLPHDLSLATIAPEPLTLSGVCVSTWVQPLTAFAEAGVALLAAAIAAPHQAQPRVVVPFSEITGETIGRLVNKTY